MRRFNPPACRGPAAATPAAARGARLGHLRSLGPGRLAHARPACLNSSRSAAG
ncbi:hypothetical protein ABLO16_15005 [Mycobacterium tuberculosis]